MTGVAPLPAGSILLHVGLPKTGTTAIQYAASQLRRKLLELGVCYPGSGLNHRAAARALMGLELRGDRFPISMWDDVVREIQESEARVGFISQELISDADDEMAQRFVARLNAPAHIVITLRSFQSWLPSIWQQYVKAATRLSLEEWLDLALRDEPVQLSKPPFLYQWPTAVIRRWREAAQDVTVVVLDKARPQLLYDAFEGMLGLPAGRLAQRAPVGHRANRGLSASEMDLLLALNDAWHDRDADLGPTYYDIVRMGVVAGLQETRTPARGEPMTRMPPDAASKLAGFAQREVDQLRASEVSVIGNLEALLAGSATAVSPKPTTTLPQDLAVGALIGSLSAASYRGVAFNKKDRKVKMGVGPDA